MKGAPGHCSDEQRSEPDGLGLGAGFGDMWDPMHSPARDREAAQVLDSLRRLVRELRVGSHSVERELGIGGAQLFVLREIAAEPRCSIGRLAERTLTDQSSVSVVAARLVERGFVARERDARDARRSALTLTPLGDRLLARAGVPFQVRLVRALRTLPHARLSRLGNDLSFVVEAVGADTGEAPMFFDDEPKKRRPRRGR
jgi:DNA-binding MarR family transcriptional regulator